MKKIVIWGHKLHSHTHSYVHYGFWKAFQNMGHETLWLDDTDDVSSINFDNCLFLTEGQVDKKIPINKSSQYVLHNCELDKYEKISDKINIQFLHCDIEGDPHSNQHSTFVAKSPGKQVNTYTYLSKETLYQPWATDLLPHEIDESNAHNEIQNRECVWVGTYGGGDSEFQNGSALDPFFNECRKNKISVKTVDPWGAPVSPEENRKLIRNAFLAPALQGEWQVKFGYIPCRIFKNISYGHMAITNNKFVPAMFESFIVYSNDPIDLFEKSLSKKTDSNITLGIKKLMIEVKNNHTFINRARNILMALEGKL